MKIMLVLLKTFGDVLLGTTICHELKKEYPDASISFYVNKPYDQLLRNNPDIDDIQVSDQWLPDMIFMDMSVKKYDKVYLPYQVRGECNMWHQDNQFRHQHLLDFYWKRMGMHRLITDRECYVFPQEDDFTKARKWISMDVPRIAIHSTSGVATKDWPYFEQFVEDCRKGGYGCVQVGAYSDKKIKGAVDFCGKMGLLELAAFLSKCAVFIGLDSGLSYLADAMKVPTIVIQGSTNPKTSGPISDRVIHLFAKETGYEDCQTVRCHTNCRHEINCNTKITVENLIEVVDPILEKWIRPIPVGV